MVLITEMESVYCAVRTGYLNVIWVICFIWIWEQRAIISLYSINWLVCITETECVHCAVRTGYLNVIWVICFIWISEQTTIISLYSINWWVFITETESVHCAVRTISVTLNVRLYTGHIVASDRQSSASHRGGPSSFLWLRGLWWPLGTGIGFFPSTVGSPVSAIPTAIYTLLYLFADIERQTD